MANDKSFWDSLISSAFPAPRGIPQVECPSISMPMVSSTSLHPKDLATQKGFSPSKITASSGLSKRKWTKLVKDAQSRHRR